IQAAEEAVAECVLVASDLKQLPCMKRVRAEQLYEIRSRMHDAMDMAEILMMVVAQELGAATPHIAIAGQLTAESAHVLAVILPRWMWDLIIVRSTVAGAVDAEPKTIARVWRRIAPKLREAWVDIDPLRLLAEVGKEARLAIA